jgi:excisionase family DNA binding protein
MENVGNNISPDGFATVAETADYLGLSRAKVYQIMDAGEIRFAKFGHARRIPWASIVEYAQKSMVPVSA